MTARARMNLVTDPGGETMSLGDRQADVCLARGWITLEGVEPDPYRPDLMERRHFALARGWTLGELDARGISDPVLRECDFCRANPAPFDVKLRRFISLPEAWGAGELRRPIVCCEACARSVEATAKTELIERVIDRALAEAERTSDDWKSHLARLGGSARRGVAPAAREFVTDVFANRDGRPYPHDDPPR